MNDSGLRQPADLDGTWQGSHERRPEGRVGV